MGLMRRLVLGDLDLTDYPFSVEFDEDHGAPENVYDTLVSMLADGELMSSSRVSNREITITVLVEGPTLADLAANEAALVAECEKPRSTLTVDPGDTYAVASVFDVFRVQARLQYDPNLEQANFRRYELTIPALPHVRGEELVVTPAQTSAETVVDDCSSATGWENGLGGAPTVSAGTLQSPNFQLVRVTATSVPAGGYVSFTWQATYPVSSVRLYKLAGGSSGPVASVVSGGWTTSYFDLGGAYNGGLLLLVSGTSAGTLSVDKVSTWTGLPFIGTARQKAMSLVPGGSVRTQGSIQVAHPTNTLGKTIVYTHPSGTGYLPPLRPWLVSSEAVTTDASLVSGARNAIAPTKTQYSIPMSNLPAGRVELWAWLRKTSGTGSVDISWAVASDMGGSLLSYELRTVSIAFAVTNAWYLVPLGATVSPPTQIGPAGTFKVDLNCADSSIQVDEAYIFATDLGGLTVVDCGTGAIAYGGSSNRLWIDAPSAEVPAGGVYIGERDDRSNQFHAGSRATVWQTHNFDPAGTSVFVATPNTTDAVTSLTHYQRFHTHASDT